MAQRVEAQKQRKQASKKASLEDLFAAYQAGEAKELSLIIKADVQGSLEPREEDRACRRTQVGA